MNAKRASDFTVYIVHDAKSDETWRFTSEAEAYAMWLEAEGSQCDAYNSAEHWSMSLDAQFEDYRDEERADALSWARHERSYARAS
jgi:hypothetical protein